MILASKDENNLVNAELNGYCKLLISALFKAIDSIPYNSTGLQLEAIKDNVNPTGALLPTFLNIPFNIMEN